MKILILHRPNAQSGGDMTALNGYAGALSRLDVDVELRGADQVGEIYPFDFVHLWAACSPDWGLPAAREVRRLGGVLIITPFWWSRAERQTYYGQAGQDIAPGYTNAVAATLARADYLFVVTMSEAVECWKLAPRVRIWAIGMGCDKPTVQAQPAEDYVICVGRVEPHKNQLSLAYACKALGMRLELVGAIAHPEYARMCEEAGAHLCGELPESERLDVLSRARVHALPSFFENPGLAHAEAALMGIPGVLGNRGCEPEFFGPSGIYCDPTKPDDIESALAEAWRHPRRQWANVPSYDDMAKVAWHALESLRCKSERSVEIPWLLSRIGRPTHILDIGSAGAKYLSALAATGAEVTAIDTREFVPPVGVTAYQLDARKLPEEWAGHFDVVTCVSALDHVGLDAYGNTEDAAALPDVIREIERVIAPGGRLLLTVPVGRPQITTHPGGGQRVFSPNEIAAEAALAGFFDMDSWRWEQSRFWKRTDNTYHEVALPDILDAEYDGWRADACGAWEMTKK